MQENEEARLKALYDYEILDSGKERDFDRLTEIASLICECEMSLISFAEKDRLWYKSAKGISVNEVPRGIAMCEFPLLGNDIFVVEDMLADERFKHHSLLEDGSRIRFYAGYPLIDPRGFILGSICVVDRTPKRLTSIQQKSLLLLAEEAISIIINRRKKQEYNNFVELFKSSEDLICILGADGRFKKVNPHFQKRLGWGKEELKLKTIFDIIPEEGLREARVIWNELNNGIAPENPTHQLSIKNGGFRMIEWAATTEKVDGDLFAIGRDVTAEVEKNLALRASEQKLKAFFESSQGLMCTHDINGKLLSLNPAGAKTLGYGRTELLEKSLFDIIPIERHGNLRQYLSDILMDGFSKGYMVIKRKSGEERLWLYSNILQRDPGEEPYIVGNAVDITAQKKQENDLIHTKKLLEETSSLAKIGGWELDLNESKLSWSKVTCEIHNVPEGFVPCFEKAIEFYKPGESQEAIVLAVQECISSGKAWDLEVQIVDFNGQEIWVRSKGHSDSLDIERNRIYGTFQNIDEQKRAQLAVAESKKLLDDVLSAAADVSIIATDQDGLITVFNKGAVQMLEYTAEEMIGKHTPELFHDPNEIAELCADISTSPTFEGSGFSVFKHCADSPIKERIFTFVRKSGSRVRASLSITSIRDSKGGIIGYLGIATDITQKEKIEEQLALEKAVLLAFIENAPASVAMLDRNMHFLAASRKWIKEYTQIKGNIEGLSYYDVFPKLSEHRKANHRKVLAGQTIRKDEDIYVDIRKGTQHQIAWEMRPWHRLDKSIGGMMIFTNDISAIVNHREELTAARLRADFANAAKSEFLANMSHEIRTPLNGVIGFTDLVLKTQLNSTQQQYLKIVNQSANALLGIINDILDFSKIEAGKFELDIDKCDLYEIVWQASDITTYQIQAKSLEMLLNLPPDLPRFVWADALRLKQILINLLGNAAKFTNTGEIELRLETLNKDKDKHLLRFSVRDTGVGIAKATQSKIFNAFSQEDSSTTKKYGGTGLGLTISNKLLHMMDSHLNLESAPGEGSMFYFDIELLSEQGDPIEWVGIENINKVLIVDDNDNNRIILEDMLSLKNIKSDQARNGFEALQFLAEGRIYDAILMDYHMQYMDGLETATKIRENFTDGEENIPLILLHSSSDDGKIIKTCNDLHIDNRLLKPIKMDDLYHALARLKTNGPIIKVPDLYLSKIDKRRAYRFMIVEDNEVNRFLSRSLIEKLYPNSTIMEAENGMLGIALFKKESFDLIFMDIQMPEMNGYECSRKIRLLEKGRMIPIIALTAANVMGEREKSIAAGMNDFITKPVLEETIELILDKWLNKPEKVGLAEEKFLITPNLAHFNGKKLESYFNQDHIKLKKIIGITINQLDQAFIKLDKKISISDTEMIMSLSHKLYGMSTTAGLMNLAEISGRVNETDLVDQASLINVAQELKEEIKILIPILKRHFLSK